MHNKTVALPQTLKVLELKDHTTYQTVPSRIFSSMGPTHHKISAIYYHKRAKALLIGTMKVACVLLVHSSI